MSEKIVPVKVNKKWEKRESEQNYSGTSTSHRIPMAEIILLTNYEKRAVRLGEYPRLETLYGDVGEGPIDEQIAAVLDEEGEIIMFGESKEALTDFEAEEI